VEGQWLARPGPGARARGSLHGGQGGILVPAYMQKPVYSRHLFKLSTLSSFIVFASSVSTFNVQGSTPKHGSARRRPCAAIHARAAESLVLWRKLKLQAQLESGLSYCSFKR